MIFTMPVAEEGRPILIMVDRHAGAVQADLPLIQIVHPDQPPTQSRLDLFPNLIVAQVPQYIGQPIIGEVLDPHRLRQQNLQRVPLLLGPRLHFAHAMVPFRENVAQPRCGQPAHAQPPSIAMGLDHLVQYLRDAHLLLLMDEQWHVIYSFRPYLYFFCHSDRSLPQFPLLRKH